MERTWRGNEQEDIKNGNGKQSISYIAQKYPGSKLCVCVGRSVCERQTERDKKKQKKTPAFLNPD